MGREEDPMFRDADFEMSTSSATRREGSQTSQEIASALKGLLDRVLEAHTATGKLGRDLDSALALASTMMRLRIPEEANGGEERSRAKSEFARILHLLRTKLPLDPGGGVKSGVESTPFSEGLGMLISSLRKGLQFLDERQRVTAAVVEESCQPPEIYDKSRDSRDKNNGAAKPSKMRKQERRMWLQKMAHLTRTALPEMLQIVAEFFSLEKAAASASGKKSARGRESIMLKRDVIEALSHIKSRLRRLASKVSKVDDDGGLWRMTSRVGDGSSMLRSQKPSGSSCSDSSSRRQPRPRRKSRTSFEEGICIAVNQ